MRTTTRSCRHTAARQCADSTTRTPRNDRWRSSFRGGETNVEVVETYTARDLVVLVVIERQHGTVGDLPDQDWSLRVTWVFRRTAESDWELVHRHADALVHAIDHERLGALARGE